MALTDEDLLRQVAGGGREAYIALYDRYAPRVFGLLIRLLPDRTEAEDVLQEVMWEIWRKADRYDPSIGSAQTWILLTARSRAIDAVRRMRRASQRTQAAGWDESSATPPDRTTGVPTSAGDGRLGDAMAGLPEEQEAAIRLAFVHGLTRKEIAEVTGVPIGTVKTRISLAVRKLGEIVRADGKGVGK